MWIVIKIRRQDKEEYYDYDQESGFLYWKTSMDHDQDQDKKECLDCYDQEYKYKTIKGPLQCAPNTGPKMYSGQNI